MGLKPGPEGKAAACRHLIWLWEECPSGGNSQHKGSEARLRPRAAARNWRGMDGLRERVAVTGGQGMQATARVMAVIPVQNGKLQWPWWTFGLTSEAPTGHLTGEHLRVPPAPSCLLRLPRGRLFQRLFHRSCLDTSQARPTGLPATECCYGLHPARSVLSTRQEKPTSRASKKASSELGGIH